MIPLIAKIQDYTNGTHIVELTEKQDLKITLELLDKYKDYNIIAYLSKYHNSETDVDTELELQCYDNKIGFIITSAELVKMKDIDYRYDIIAKYKEEKETLFVGHILVTESTKHVYESINIVC